MKKLSLILIAILFAVTGIYAQTPEMFKYQAVLRDASGNIIANQNKTVVIDILKGSTSGNSVFTESHSVTTTAQGLINLNIGDTQSLSGIDWSADDYFIQITVDGTIMGTSQLLSVPYALQAKEVENVDYSQITNAPAYGTHYLGEEYLGGIIFYLYTGSDNQQHGLIVSTSETTAKYQNTGTLLGTDRTWDGAYNTSLMTDSPAKDWITTNFDTNWYLPSIDELSLLWQNRFIVNNALNAGSYTLISYKYPSYYHSSTEINATYDNQFRFDYGYEEPNNKNSIVNIRAVRAF